MRRLRSFLDEKEKVIINEQLERFMKEIVEKTRNFKNNLTYDVISK